VVCFQDCSGPFFEGQGLGGHGFEAFATAMEGCVRQRQDDFRMVWLGRSDAVAGTKGQSLRRKGAFGCVVVDRQSGDQCLIVKHLGP
jgi:hypothetical protein